MKRAILFGATAIGAVIFLSACANQKTATTSKTTRVPSENALAASGVGGGGGGPGVSTGATSGVSAHYEH